jgi:hypothetical protein
MSRVFTRQPPINSTASDVRHARPERAQSRVIGKYCALMAWIARSTMVVCCIAVLGGCGATNNPPSGSQNRSESAGGGLKSAAEACSRFYSAAYAIAPPIGIKGILRVAHKHIQLQSREIRALRAVTPPRNDRLNYERLLSDLSGLTNAEVALLLNPRGPKTASLIAVGTSTRARLQVDAGRAQLPRCGADPYSASRSFTSTGFTSAKGFSSATPTPARS